MLRSLRQFHRLLFRGRSHLDRRHAAAGPDADNEQRADGHDAPASMNPDQ